MERLIFTCVSQSSGALYELVASHDGDKFRLTCACAAGQRGGMCKHKASLLAGTFDVFQPVSPETRARFGELLAQSTVPALLERLAESERAAERAKAAVKAAGRQLARVLEQGG